MFILQLMRLLHNKSRYLIQRFFFYPPVLTLYYKKKLEKDELHFF